ncbi:MAG: hypothetical protein ACUZ8I_07680 [Candidatus Scalindua sp.]
MRTSIKLFVLAVVAMFMFAGCLAEGVSFKTDKIDTKVGSAEGIDINADKIDTKN